MSTFIGKILVIAITAVSLLFLGISTVAFATARNWPTVTAAEAKKLDEVKKKLQAVQQDADVAKKGLDDAKAALENETKSLTGRLATYAEENKRDLEKIAATSDQLAKAEDIARTTLEQVQAKREEIAKLQQQQAAVDKQAKEFRLHQNELIDRIRELERILETAAKNHGELHKPSRRVSAMVR